ncbi:MAG TPA: GNAT family N-acetyltransferase [Vicinamibacterales bacterium]|nr:GNAT family N-acetyltransferase [Vicinamibacterales bacterium]
MSDQLVAATGAHLEQILQESFPIWGDGLAEEQYSRFWTAQLRTPWGGSHLDRVALVERGAVTSSAKRYDLSARFDGRIRRVLGIGAVFTSPGRRGQGGARRLLQLMLEAAEAEGYEFAMLFSEIEPAFYERLEFVPVPLLESRIEVTRGRGTPAVLVRAGDDRDIPGIAEMSANRTRDARFSLDRSDDWIRFGVTRKRLLAGLGPPGLRDIEFLVTEEGHQAVAYLVSSVYDGKWYIEDIGDRDPTGARAGAMLQLMLARTPHLDPPEIRAWLPAHFAPPQITRVDTPTAEVMMVRPLKDRTLPLPPLDATQVAFTRLDYF